MTVLPRFYPIVDSAAWVRRLVPVGVRLIQLRIKQQPLEVVRREVREALLTCRRHGAQLVVNDYWQVALDEGADFIHLGQGDLPGADLTVLRARSIKLGVSTHDHAELDQALALAPDYVALGPVYPTTLKVMPWAPQGLDRVSEWKRLVGTRPLVAIGGLDIERGRRCRAAGADILSVVSDVTGAARPLARARAWIDAMDALV